MLSARMTVNLWATDADVPSWDGNSLRISDGDVEVVLHLPVDSAGGWCTRVAYALLAKAEEAAVEQRTFQRYLADAAEMVATIRREKGEIADDGWCWDCKADNHEGHKVYNEGRCYGCGCHHGVSAVAP